MSPEQSPEWRRGDTFRSIRDLGREALRGLLSMVDSAQDCFGDDDPEDQEIKSGRFA